MAPRVEAEHLSATHEENLSPLGSKQLWREIVLEQSGYLARSIEPVLVASTFAFVHRGKRVELRPGKTGEADAAYRMDKGQKRSSPGLDGDETTPRPKHAPRLP